MTGVVHSSVREIKQRAANIQPEKAGTLRRGREDVRYKDPPPFGSNRNLCDSSRSGVS
jgi:hypothetical protein